MTDLTCAKCGKPIGISDTCYTPLDDPLTHYHCTCWPKKTDSGLVVSVGSAPKRTYEQLENERNAALVKLRLLRAGLEKWAQGMDLGCVLNERWHDDPNCHCHDCTIHDAWKATVPE